MFLTSSYFPDFFLLIAFFFSSLSLLPFFCRSASVFLFSSFNFSSFLLPLSPDPPDPPTLVKERAATAEPREAPKPGDQCRPNRSGKEWKKKEKNENRWTEDKENRNAKEGFF